MKSKVSINSALPIIRGHGEEDRVQIIHKSSDNPKHILHYGANK